MTAFEAVEIIEGRVSEEEINERLTEAWQHLINTGIVWKLQGFYGRAATSLIEQGLCHR